MASFIVRNATKSQTWLLVVSLAFSKSLGDGLLHDHEVHQVLGLTDMRATPFGLDSY